MIRLLLLLLFTLPLQAHTYYLSVAALFRNEARFLKEWIEYHHMLGVDHFYLFNNLSEDNYLEVLRPYINAGLVDLYEWPISTSGINQFGNYVQRPVYQQIIQQKQDETFWLAFIDTDEFIVPKQHNSIPEFLKKFEKYGGVVLNWQMFGTSNVSRIPQDKLLIEMLTKRGPENDGESYYVKSIVIPSRISYMVDAHYACYFPSYYSVAENERKTTGQRQTKKVRVKRMQINHYVYRDQEFFNTEKIRRYTAWYKDRTPRIKPEYSSITDTSIARFVPELKRRMGLDD